MSGVVKDIETALMDMADTRQAQLQLRFFKTGPGEYGEGDRFIGLKNPQVRMVVKEAWKNTTLYDAAQLAINRFHEVRLCGLLIMVEHYLKAMKQNDAAYMAEVFSTYTRLHEHINNWDLVDLSAIKIVGNHEALNPDVRIMDDWIKPENNTMWQQRIAMVSTWMLIRYGRENVCFERAKSLLGSPHDLLHKAAGWMLRETWKMGYKEELRTFLEENIHKMPSVMLSYASEQMTIDERHEWQSKRKKRD